MVPDDQVSLIPAELEHIETWASRNNLKLNVLKSKELIVKRPKTKSTDFPPPLAGIERVASLKILGVIFDGDLNFSLHVEKLVSQSNQRLYALKQLKSQGLAGSKLWNVTTATLVSGLTYASSAWWSMISEGSKQRLQSILNKTIKQGFLSNTQLSIAELCEAADDKLFESILRNPSHVLHRILPPIKHCKFI